MPTYTAYGRYDDLYLQFTFERDTPYITDDGPLTVSDLELSVALEVPGSVFDEFDYFPDELWFVVDEERAIVLACEPQFAVPGPADLYRERLEERTREALERFGAGGEEAPPGRVGDGMPFPHPRFRGRWRRWGQDGWDSGS